MTDDAQTLADAQPATAPARATPSLAAARARQDAGDLAGADAIFAALYDQRQPDPAVLTAWSRLRRRAGDLKNGFAMLELAHRAGGGAPTLVEMAGLLIDQNQIQQAANLLRQASQTGPKPGAKSGLKPGVKPGQATGRGPAFDYQAARLEALQRRLPQAAALFRAVMKADPNHTEARFGLARTLAQMGEVREAASAYAALLKREPGNLQIMAELAYMYGAQARFADALSLYDTIARSGADIVREFSQVALGMMHVCDWSARDALTDRIAARMAVIRPAVFETYALLAATDNPALHRLMAERIAGALRDASAARPRPLPRPVGPADRRLRIGYLSGDFCQHATSLLLAGVIEAHDRAGFEVFAYDYSPDDNSPTRARILAAFEHVVPLGNQSPADSAARMAADEIDILVDLKGYTERTRTEILCLRPAPIQVNFLGYTATQGAEWIDYAIADAVILPPDQEVHWTEQVVRLPASAWPSDRTRPTPEPDTDRVANGLPQAAIVFACFNNTFKITPAIFAAWMDILRKTPAGVLWLFEANPHVAGNLRAEATQAGIDPARLVFAKPAPLDRHIARHACADIVLDTMPYGAHTTALDALWAGVPLITCMGQTAASRAGASLLRTAGLPELITETLADYIALAVALAADPHRRAELRARLLAARTASPLFDAAAFARALEQAYRKMAETHRAGGLPAPLDIT